MMNKKTAPVGVFDSGVGGLTVAREISRQLPDENIGYFGDTARVPYGSKSQNTIIRFSEQIIRFLKTKEVKVIVIACNTASALALDAVKDEFDIPILGVVIPGARAAVQATKNGKVGVVGTEATVQSGMYTKVIQGMNPEITVIEKACPLFVPLVEEGFKSGAKAIIVCNPSNPCGKVFTREELMQIGDLAIKYDGFVVTDEVMAELRMVTSRISAFTRYKKFKSKEMLTL